ncbi:MAG: TonB-dependent receptor [Pseudomonadota bacterium]
MRIEKKLFMILIFCHILIGNTFGEESDTKNSGSLVITQEKIKSLSVHTLVELLNQLPGVTATESSISLQGAPTKQVLVLLDGRPLTDPVSGGVDLRGISVYSIEKVEIIKGAGAVLYGDNTTGGVILITTRKAHSAYKNRVEASYGSFNTQIYDFDLGTQVKATGLSLSGNYKRSDGHRKNSDSETWGGKIGINSRLGKEIDLRLSLNYSRKEKGYSGPTYSPTPLARSEQQGWGSTLLLKYRALNSRTYYTGFDDYYNDPNNKKKTDLKIQIIGEDVKWEGDLPRIGAVLLGLNGELRRAEATAIGKHDENQFSIYGSKEISGGGWPLSLRLGLRLNKHSDFGSSYNPEAGIFYKLKGWEASIQVNRSSNTPSFRQRYYESTFTKGNPDLGMEQATNYQLNLSAKIMDSFSWSATAFWSQVEDGIATVKGTDGIYRYANISSSSRKGAEAGFDWKIVEWLGIDASYIYLIAKDESTGLFLTHKPKHKANFNIRLSKWDGALILRGKYVDRSFDNSANTEVLDSYFAADAKLAYKIKAVNMFFEVNNLFDKVHYAHLGYPSEGRTYAAGLSYEF